MKLDCCSTERGALLSAFTGYVKHQRFSECNFFGFRGIEFLMDQAGRSAIASEAGGDMEVDLRPGTHYHHVT